MFERQRLDSAEINARVAERKRVLREEAQQAEAAKYSQLQPGQSVIQETITPLMGLQQEAARRYDEQQDEGGGWGMTSAPVEYEEKFEEQVAQASSTGTVAEAQSYVGESPADVYDFWEDEGGWAGGGPVFRDTLALVGEEGPEYVKLPQGARVIPADATQEMRRGRRPRPMAEGGLVFDEPTEQGIRDLTWGDVRSVGGEGVEITDKSDPNYGKIREAYFTTEAGLAALRGGATRADIPTYTRAQIDAGGIPFGGESYPTPAQLPGAGAELAGWQGGRVPRPPDFGLGSTQVPAGVRRVHQGLPLAPTRNRLFRAAGLTVPSAQALRNFLPEELEVFREQGRLAGIPEGAFNQELIAGLPAGGVAPRSLALAPRRVRR